jgi:hypothetical protein
MFVEVNGKIFEKEEYLKSVGVLKLILDDEIKAIAKKYGFKDFYHKDLEIVLHWNLSTKNYLKEV